MEYLQHSRYIYGPYENQSIELNSINEELNGVICDINKQVSTLPGLMNIFTILRFPCIQCSAVLHLTGKLPVHQPKDCLREIADGCWHNLLSIVYSCIFDLYSLKHKFVKGEFSDATALRKEADNFY